MPNIFPDISTLETLASLAQPNAPALLDIRLDEDVAQDPTRLPTAQTVAYDDREAQLALARPNGAIVICHKGLKLSAGVTARLIAEGISAHRLRGGHVGWTDAGLATSSAPPPQTIALALDADAQETLATWAMLRFSAPKAELLEVPREDLSGVVERFGAQTSGPLPKLPGMLALQSATQLLTIALQNAHPSATFAMLDLAYRGALRNTPTGREARQ